MSAKSHGQSLATKLQRSGATFTRTKGGFDSGTRTYTIDTASVSDLTIPTVGSVDAVYPNMYVITAEVVDGRAGLSTVTVTYNGIMGTSKADDYTITTHKEIGSDTPDSESIEGAPSGTSASGTIHWMRSLPTVTRKYISTSYPSPAVIGTQQAPPLYAGYSEVFYYSTRRRNYYPVFVGWLLIDRTVQPATPMGQLYEVTDVHQFVIHEVKAI